MARLFDDASSQGLKLTSAILTNEPLTMACWFYCDDVSTAVAQTLMSIGKGNSNGLFNLQAQVNVAGDPVRAQKQNDSGTIGPATTSTGITVNTWMHAAAIFTSDTSRAAALNGVLSAVDTTNISDPTSLADTSIGCRLSASVPNYFSGRIADAAIWSAALTAEEVAALAAGASPLGIRPGSLRAFWPLRRSEDTDLLGAFNLTALNSPTVAEHKPTVRRRRLWIPAPQSAVWRRSRGPLGARTAARQSV